MPELAVDRVVVHPLVLLSVVDHFNRWGPAGGGAAALSHGPEPRRSVRNAGLRGAGAGRSLGSRPRGEGSAARSALGWAPSSGGGRRVLGRQRAAGGPSRCGELCGRGGGKGSPEPAAVRALAAERDPLSGGVVPPVAVLQPLTRAPAQLGAALRGSPLCGTAPCSAPRRAPPRSEVW